MLYGAGLIGRVDIDDNLNYKKYMYIKDHLGSIRMTLNEYGGVENAYDYYPYGEVNPEMSFSNQTDSRYKFTEKERDLGTNYDYFGARYYDSELGRWQSVDPKAHLRLGLSPYSYCQNNPLTRIDRDGNLDNDTDGDKKKKEEKNEENNEEKKEIKESNDKMATYSFTHTPYLMVEGGGFIGGQYTIDVTVSSNNDQVNVMVSGSTNATNLGDVSFYGKVELMTNNVSLSSQSLQKIDGPTIGNPDKSFVGGASFNIPKLQLGDGRSVGLNIPLSLKVTTGYSVKVPEGNAYPVPSKFTDNIRFK